MKQHLTTIALFLLFITKALQAQTWVQQHPNHSLKDLNDVNFNSQGKGIAVGEGKTVLTTTNWGVTWTEQVFSLSGTTLYKVRFAPDPGSQVAYVLEHTRIFKTTDAGTTWTLLALSGVGAVGSTKALEVISENEVFVLGASNILHTLDGGTTWNSIDKPSSDITIKSFQFLTPQLGWIGGSDGEIFGTADGGANWVVLDTTQFDKPVNLRFFNANVGYAGISKALAKTTDGGHTWTVVDDQAFPSNIYDIAVVSATKAFFAYGNRVYYTSDGGAVVQYAQPFRYSSSNKGLFALADGRVWVASDYHSIGFSGDDGEHYEEQVPGNKNFFQDISFLDANNGWAAGYNFTIFRTVDGGDTWEDLSPDPSPTSMWIVRGGLAVSTEEFWVCGTNFVSKTTDGGDTWTSIGQGNASTNCLVATSNAVYAALTNGRVYKTTDGGGSWTFKEVQAQSTLVSMSFPTDNTGYVGGWAGVVAKTTDAGATWTVLDFPSTDNIAEVSFLDENTGWVGLDRFSSVIYQTADGGQNWTPISLPLGAYWYNIHFLDAQKGYVAGGSSGIGRVYSTVDGGVTWVPVYTGERVAKGFSLVSTATEELLWICGDGGHIAHTATPKLSSVFNINEAETLELFPNPTNGIVNMTAAGQFSQDALLDILDLQGRVVVQMSSVPESLVLGALKSGLYWVRIQDKGRLYIGKLIME